MKTLKRTFAVILAAAMVITAFALPVMAKGPHTDKLGDMTYTLNNYAGTCQHDFSPLEGVDKITYSTGQTTTVPGDGWWETTNAVIDNAGERRYNILESISDSFAVHVFLGIKMDQNAGLNDAAERSADNWNSYAADYEKNVNYHTSVNYQSRDFIQINGRKYYAVILTEHDDYTKRQLYFTAYKGNIYVIEYAYANIEDSEYAPENFSVLSDLLNSITFAGDTSSGSGETRRGGKTTTVDDDGNTIVEYLWDDAIKIYVNNERITPDTNPIIVNDRTLVPIRAIAEKLGYSVNWFGDSQTVSMQKGSDLIQLSIGSKSLYHNSTNIIIDVAPLIYNDRTYLPVRAVAEAMGAKVDWSDSENAVYITK